MLFTYDKFIVRLLNKHDSKELKEVQRLRYEHLLRDFKPSLPEDGIDDDGYDKYADAILVIDQETNKIVGTYRIATKKTVGNHTFYVEDEFNIDAIKNDEEEILELGRAVVHTDYRNGVVIQLLWAAIYEYVKENNIRYMFGTCSLHGTDPKKYCNLLNYIKNDLLFDKPIYATHNAFEYEVDNYEEEKVKEEMPNLLKAYIKMGVKISNNGYIDYDFNSCDVFIVADVKNGNTKFFERLGKFVNR